MAATCQPSSLLRFAKYSISSCELNPSRPGPHGPCLVPTSPAPARQRVTGRAATARSCPSQDVFAAPCGVHECSSSERRTPSMSRGALNPEPYHNRGHGRPGSASLARAAAAAPGAGEASPPMVVLTREKGKNGKLRKALEREGISCLELPLIESTQGPDLPTLELLLRESASSLEWVVITSPEAAAVFLESWRASGRPQVTLAVVGGGTAEAFAGLSAEEKRLLPIGFTPSKATAKFLAAEIPAPAQASSTVLYPSSMKASNDLESGLQQRGFNVIRLNTYSTETVKDVDPSVLATAAKAPVATFGSPTAVRAWMELVVPLGWNGAAACIGETSAVAARKAGLQRVHNPEKPGIEGWVQSVVDALAVSATAL